MPRSRSRKVIIVALLFTLAVVCGAGVFKTTMKKELTATVISPQGNAGIVILNPEERPRTGDTWSVRFSTSGTADLAIAPLDAATIEDLRFVRLRCNGKEVTPLRLSQGILAVPSFRCDGEASADYLIEKAGEHALNFSFGASSAVAHNAAVFQWAKRLGGTSSDFETRNSIAANESRIVVAGCVTGAADMNGDGDSTDGGAESATGFGGLDVFVAVFDTAGSLQWAARMGSTASDCARGVAIDATGIVAVTGYVGNSIDFNSDGDKTDAGEVIHSGIYPDAFVAKYSAAGVLQWGYVLGVVREDYGEAVAIGSNGYIAVAGETWGNANADLNGDGDATDGGAENYANYGDYDAFVTVFDTNGAWQWAKRLGWTGQDKGQGIAMDANNNVIATGWVTGTADLNGDADTGDANEADSPSSYTDIFVSVFDSTGTFQWSERLGGKDSTDYAYAVATDASGNVYVAGAVNANADLNGDGDATDGGAESATGYGNYDAVITAFSSNGTAQWSERLGGTNNDYTYGVSIDPGGHVALSGALYGDADVNGDGDRTDGGAESATGYGDFDAFLSVFDTSGTWQWAKRMGGTGVDKGYGSAVTSSHYIGHAGYVTGAADLNNDGDTGDGGEGVTEVYGNTDVFLTVFLNDAVPPVVTITSVAGDASAPYAGNDTTPTILFTLNETGDCYASTTLRSYQQMVDAGDVNCTEDGLSVSCTLLDPLTPDGAKSIYVACQDAVGNKDTTGTLETIAYSLDSTAPTILSATSDTADGSYNAGDVIDIDLTFSELVTSTGDVTVTLETGDTDRTCTFTVSSASSATCDYTVQAGDTAADLTISSVAGTVKDAALNSMTTPTTPTTNLAANKALVIDTTAPLTPSASPAGALYNGTQSVTLSSVGSSTIYYTTNGDVPTTGSTPYTVAISISATTTLKALAVDAAGNESGIMTESYTIDTAAPVPASIVAAAQEATATVTWTTAEAGSSVVEYGLTVAYGTSTDETDTSPRATSHTVALSGLVACSPYHYRVKSADAASNQGVSADQTFTTTGCATSGGAGGAARYWERLYENNIAPPDFVQWWENTSSAASNHAAASSASSPGSASSASSVSSLSSASSSFNPFRLLTPSSSRSSASSSASSLNRYRSQSSSRSSASADSSDSSQSSSLRSSSSARSSASSSTSLRSLFPVSLVTAGGPVSRTQRICDRVARWIPALSPRHAIVLRRLQQNLGVECGD